LGGDKDNSNWVGLGSPPFIRPTQPVGNPLTLYFPIYKKMWKSHRGGRWSNNEIGCGAMLHYHPTLSPIHFRYFVIRAGLLKIFCFFSHPDPKHLSISNVAQNAPFVFPFIQTTADCAVDKNPHKNKISIPNGKLRKRGNRCPPFSASFI
jgi:hypothetical protein